MIWAHILGHSETTSVPGPLVSPPVGKATGKAAMNPHQAIKATLTYLKSAALEGALGIAGTEATIDNDGNLPVDYINDSQYADILSILQELGKSEAAFCKWLKIESLDKMPINKFDGAIRELEKWKK